MIYKSELAPYTQCVSICLLADLLIADVLCHTGVIAVATFHVVKIPLILVVEICTS